MGFERGIVVEKVNVVVLGGGDVRERRTKAVTVAAESERLSVSNSLCMNL